MSETTKNMRKILGFDIEFGTIEHKDCRHVSPEGATEHRQVVERSETPAEELATKQNPDGVTEFLPYLRHFYPC